MRVVAGTEEPRETFREVLGQVEDFADFARRAFAAVSNTVGRHGDPFAAVAMIELLDDALAAVLAGQIEIDIGPPLAPLGKEAFEEQIHADRVDGGNAETI